MVAGIPPGPNAGSPEKWIEGENDAGAAAYTGPTPPHGETHEYHFEVFALDTMPNLKHDFSSDELTNAMEGHIIGRGELKAKYRSLDE